MNMSLSKSIHVKKRLRNHKGNEKVKPPVSLEKRLFFFGGGRVELEFLCIAVAVLKLTL